MRDLLEKIVKKQDKCKIKKSKAIKVVINLKRNNEYKQLIENRKRNCK